jgi:hypothetical protein
MWTCGWWVIAAPQLCSRGGADPGTEVLGIGGDGEQGLGRGAEQQVVDDRLVLVGDRSDLGRQDEDQVEVADRQQIGLAGGEPVLCRCPLTLGAMAVAARVVGDPVVAAVLAALDMAAERDLQFRAAHGAPATLRLAVSLRSVAPVGRAGW